MELSVIKTGWISMDQIQTIDKLRIVSTLRRLSNPEVKEVKSVIKETFIDRLKNNTKGNKHDSERRAATIDFSALSYIRRPG